MDNFHQAQMNLDIPTMPELNGIGKDDFCFRSNAGNLAHGWRQRDNTRLDNTYKEIIFEFMLLTAPTCSQLK